MYETVAELTVTETIFPLKGFEAAMINHVTT